MSESDRPKFMTTEVHPFDCRFRDHCLRLLDRFAHEVPESTIWSVKFGRFDINHSAGSLFVYDNGDSDHRIIWSDGYDVDHVPLDDLADV